VAGKLAPFVYMLIFLFYGQCRFVIAGEEIVARVILNESYGYDRPLEYIEIEIQLSADDHSKRELYFVAQGEKEQRKIPCQVIEDKIFSKQKLEQVRMVFPVSLKANNSAIYLIKQISQNDSVKSDLKVSGTGLDLIINNSFYTADLTKSNQSNGKSHESGQLQQLFIKMGFNVQLRRTENRMHWGPNFQNIDLENYETIAGWDNPKKYQLESGPFLIRTIRSDKAPDHPQILLSAMYSFYSGLPYFKFFSSMSVEQDLVLFLLRNDEMTMDSLFTHVAYEKKPGTIVDLSFAERYQIMESEPISNQARWLCFYNKDKGYAFGSIRVSYDITNEQGLPSPTYLPHTKISDGAGGGKYWNRRLIHEHPLLVPAGSRYVEKNAYIVFKIDKNDKFLEIRQWADRILHPVEITVQPGNNIPE
jgi:hypothetical protein